LRSIECEVMVRQVVEDWQADGGRLAADWLQRARRFRPPEVVAREWEGLAAHHLLLRAREEEARTDKERARIAHSVSKFRALLLTEGADPNLAVPHKVFLPNSIATDLVLRT